MLSDSFHRPDILNTVFHIIDLFAMHDFMHYMLYARDGALLHIVTHFCNLVEIFLTKYDTKAARQAIHLF